MIYAWDQVREVKKKQCYKLMNVLRESPSEEILIVFAMMHPLEIKALKNMIDEFCKKNMIIDNE